MVIKYVIRGGKVTESDGKKKVVAHLPDGLVLDSQHFFFNRGTKEYAPNQEVVEDCVQRDGVPVTISPRPSAHLTEPAKSIL